MIKLITQRAHDYIASRTTPVSISTAPGTTDVRCVVSKITIASASLPSEHLINRTECSQVPLPPAKDYDAPLVIGVDPSGKATGVAVFLRGKHVWSTTVHPDRGVKGVIQDMRSSPVKPSKAWMFVEHNDFGFKQAIASMNHAAGVIETIYTMLGVDIKLHKIKPGEWRKALGLRTKGDGLKLESMHRCGIMKIKVSSHDEAEAVLIAEYGSAQLRYLTKIDAAKETKSR